ncbi:MAG TPA: cysteine rich repeat-containing protein [Syntrophales bacterium]|nr:cysteine rich repeat-containing protein [Syntrophales bacterium]
MKKFSLFACALIFSFLAVSGPVFPQDQGGKMTPNPSMDVCKPDIEKFCKGVQPGGGRIWACLKGNEDRISQACREQMAMIRERVKGFAQACKADVEKFCKRIKPGQGRITSCLKSNQAELSDACRAYFQK